MTRLCGNRATRMDSEYIRAPLHWHLPCHTFPRHGDSRRHQVLEMRSGQFLSALKRITHSDTKGVYQLVCGSPCGAVIYFRFEQTRAFEVPDNVYRRGHAEPGEYEASEAA
jgi:hypothetical protein